MKEKLEVIARIENDFTEKFAVPRQSGLCDVASRIVFLPPYRDENALRGIEEYSHLWLIWGFSEVEKDTWSPTVRPPRLGGNARMGVFATRSPYRPNPIGLSSVRLLKVEHTEKDGCVLWVGGADLKNGTPIYDIKPYLAYTDSHPEAVGGFADRVFGEKLQVTFDGEIEAKLTPERREILVSLLCQDPRPQYQNDPDRVYTFSFGEEEISFQVKEDRLTVTNIKKSR